MDSSFDDFQLWICDLLLLFSFSSNKTYNNENHNKNNNNNNKNNNIERKKGYKKEREREEEEEEEEKKDYQAIDDIPRHDLRAIRSIVTLKRRAMRRAMSSMVIVRAK